MKKYISLLLVCAALFSLCTFADAATDKAGSPSLQELMAGFAVNVQPGTAGSSLKAVKEAAKLMDWGISTKLSDEEITRAVQEHFETLDAEASITYLEQLAQLDSTYQLLLTDGQEELLESAGCTNAGYPWGGKPIPAVETFFEASGVRRLTGIYTGDYAEFLETYCHALDEKWPMDKLAMNGINFNTQDYYDMPDRLSVLGFRVSDVNFDGIEELLVGSMNDTTLVNDMYTYVDGARTMIIQGSANDRWHICYDGTICSDTYRNGNSRGYHYYTLKDGWLIPFGCIIYDAPSNHWFIGADEDWNVSNDTPVDANFAMQKIAEYESQYADNAYIPFSALQK